VRSVLIRVGVATALLVGAALYARADSDSLSSWNDGKTKQAIVGFVKRVATPGSPDFVIPEARIAVFDNDGTLWSEQPMYFQVAFAMDRAKTLPAKKPELASMHSVEELVAATHAGMTTDEFQKLVTDWLAVAKHPTLGRPYDRCVYQPMLELLAYLRLNGFKTYIVSGGGVEFMRVWAEKAYGIPPEQVIGSSGKLKYELRDGKPVLVKLAEVEIIDDGPGKPASIQRVIGRRPIFAFGNSDGDREMLEWTAAGQGARFAGLVHHTDAEREWAYDRESHIGKLDKAWDEAKAKGWTVVDMKSDWKVVYPAAE